MANIEVQADSITNGTSENDVFHITNGTHNATIVAGNKGVDSLHFDMQLKSCLASAIDGTKDLSLRYNTLMDNTYYTLTIKDYFTSNAHTDSRSSLKNIYFVDRFDEVQDGIFTDLIKFQNTYTLRGLVATGSKFSDNIDLSTKNGKYTINGGAGNDHLVGSQGDDKINGGAGDDELYGYSGSDTMTGGAGHNIYSFWPQEGDDTIVPTAKESIELQIGSNVEGDLDNMAFVLDGKGNAEVVIDPNDETKGKVTLRNFARINNVTDAIISGSSIATQNLINDVTWQVTPDKNYTGSYLKENINASGYTVYNRDHTENLNNKRGLTIDAGAGNDTITGSKYNDNIRGGEGSDTFNASLGDDTYTGGKGTNNIIYSASDFGDDVIVLTKGETLNITGLNFEGIEDADRLSAGKIKNDLLITSKYGTVTLKNYYKNDTGATVTINGVDVVNVLGTSPYMEEYKKFVGIATGANTFNANTKLTTYTGTALADRMDATDMTARTNIRGQVIEGKGLTINTGFGNDRIKASNFDDVINTGDGDDYIWATTGNDSITGGRGTNTIYYSNSDFGNDTITLTKGETLNISGLSFDGIAVKDRYKAAANKRDLLITSKYGTVTLKNYYAANIDATVKIGATPLDSLLKIYFDETNLSRAGALTGSRHADDINVSAMTAPTRTIRGVEYGATINSGDGSDTITGSGYNDTINTGLGDDKINGSAGADTLTGGSGHNTIVYTSLDQLDGDRINLTKGEQLSIDISEITDATVAYNVNGRDLDVTVTKDTVSKTFKLVNFGTADVTNNATRLTPNTSYVELVTDDAPYPIDLRTQLVNSASGTWHDDYIDKSTAARSNTINGGAGDDVIIASNHGDRINAGDGDDTAFGGDGKDILTGGNGDDTLWGGYGNDTIKGGNGDDRIIGEQGDDQLYGELGNNTFEFRVGDGNDTIYSGKGEDTIKFVGDVTTVTTEAATNKKDLIIRYSENDTITVKDYFRVVRNQVTGVNPNNTVKYVQLSGHKISIETLRTITNTISSTASTLSGTDENDLILPTGDNQTVNAENGNDIIIVKDDVNAINVYAGEGDDTIYSGNRGSYYTGNGNNTVFVGNRAQTKYFYFGDGNDTIYTSSDTAYNGDLYYITQGNIVNGGHDVMHWGGHHGGQYGGQGDMLDFQNTQFDNMVFTRDEGSNDLVIRYGDDNDLTLKDFYKTGNEQWGSGDMVLMARVGTDNTGWLTLNNAIAQKGGVKTSCIIGTDDAETINGTSGDDAIITKGGNDTVNLGAGNDILLCGSGDKIITAASGNNIINLGSGSNHVTLGTGSDTIKSGEGVNLFRFSSSDTGNDVYTYGNGIDQLQFIGEPLSGLSIDTTGDDIVLTRSNDVTLTIKNLDSLTTGVTLADSQDNESNLFNINTTTGSLTATLAQTITTGAGNDNISVGLGDDSINAGTGTNTIHLSALANADNNDTYTYAGGTDTFVLPVEDFTTFKMLKAGDDLIVGYNGNTSNNTVIIKNYYANTAMNTSISFKAGNTTKTLAALITEKGINEPIIGTDADETLGNALFEDNQTIYGMGGNDTLNGGAGDDYLNGGTGADVFNGRAGDDTYFIDEDDWGDGQDVITDTAGDDTLKINTTADKINLFFDVTLNKEGDEVIMDGANATYTAGNDLYIAEDNSFTLDNVKTYDGVKIVNYFTEDGAIERVQIPDDANWGDAFHPNLIGLTGQIVANWLNKNGFDSTTDAISTGTAEQKAALLNLYKPFISSSNINATTGDDIIIATGSNKTITAYAGDDVIFADPDKGNYVYAGDGDDIIYTGNAGQYYTGNGNNTVYAGKRNSSKYIYFGEGNDTMYTSSDTAWNGDLYYITHGGVTNGGHDVMHWGGHHGGQYGGQGDMLDFINTEFDDLAFTRDDGSDDLVIRYGNDNDLTMKDFYKAENEQWGSGDMVMMARSGTDNTNWININGAITKSGGLKTVTDGLTGTAADEYIKGTSGNDVITSNGGDDHLNGGAGDDIYNVASLADRTTIFDSAGNDTLNIAANKDDINIIFNINKDGEFNNSEDRVYLVDDETYNSWKTNGTHPATGINISGSSSIETINSADDYKIANLGQLKSDVASWLSTANGGAGYTDVVTALKSGDDVSALVAIFDRAENWVANT